MIWARSRWRSPPWSVTDPIDYLWPCKICGVSLPLFDQTAGEATHRLRSAVPIVPGASHLFEETGTLDQVVERSGKWFCEHLEKDE